MSSLFYLITRRIKNSLKEAVKTPGKLIPLLFVVGFVGLSVYQAATRPMSSGEGDISELYAICLGFYTLIFIISSNKGFSGGATMFSMADVNLAFTGPFSGRRVLSYGLVQQLGQSLLLGAVILYQFGWLNDRYGIGLGELMLLLLGYSITVFVGRLTAMLIYMFTASNTLRRGIVKTIYYAIPLSYGAYAFFTLYPSQGELLKKLVALANTEAFGFFPVSGWVSFAIRFILEGNVLFALLALLGTAAFVGLCYLLISLAKSDYYEDVLQATETSFSAITARKEGKLNETGKQKVKVGRTGINAGSGASVFFFKHMLENRRADYFFLSLSSIVVAGTTVVMALLIKDNLYIALGLNIYMLIFFIGTGRWARELRLPYVYLIPESAFKKLVFCVMETLPRLLLEGLVAFVPVAFIVGLSPADTIGLVVARTSFALLFLGVNLLMERLMGSSQKKTLTVVVYMLLSMLFIVPAIVAGGAVCTLAQVEPLSVFTMLGVTGANLLSATVLLALSRNILEYAELNNT